MQYHGTEVVMSLQISKQIPLMTSNNNSALLLFEGSQCNVAVYCVPLPQLTHSENVVYIKYKRD